MNVTAVEYDLADLLRQAGARVHGNRTDCPWCGGRRTISHTNKVYFCHRCGAKGNDFTLARDLGLARRLSPAEARCLCLERKKAQAVANAFLALAQNVRFGLDALHIELLNMRDEAEQQLQADPHDENVWETLALVYSELRRVRADLVLLSDGTVGDRIAWLKADEEKRHEMADRILLVGAVPTFDGKWAEVCDLPCPCGTGIDDQKVIWASDPTSAEPEVMQPGSGIMWVAQSPQ